MANREISIGRSSSCDISLGERAEYASSFHGKIFMNGTQLMYKDMSTNVSASTLDQIKSLNTGIGMAFGTGFSIPTLIKFDLLLLMKYLNLYN